MKLQLLRREAPSLKMGSGFFKICLKKCYSCIILGVDFRSARRQCVHQCHLAKIECWRVKCALLA